MSGNSEFNAGVARILDEVTLYAPEAYRFVADAVTFTVSKLPSHRHVSAAELLAGARGFAAAEFGAVAGVVLAEWGIRDAADVGRIVYLLIGVGLLSASEEDSPEDFNIPFALVSVQPESLPADEVQLPLLDV